MKQRLVYIDQLKGFAILMVVIGHVVQFCFKECETSLTYKAIVSFHMPLFAFLSGLMFTALYKPQEICSKFLKQSRKLLLPFLSFLFIYAYTIRPDENMATHPFKLGLWYLLFLWQCYLLTHAYNTLIFRYVISAKRSIQLALDIVWFTTTFVCFRFLFMHLATDTAGMFGIIHLYKLYPFFFIGSLVKKYSVFESLFGKNRLMADVSLLAWTFLFVISAFVYSSAIIVLLLGALAVYPIVLWFYRNEGGEDVEKRWSCSGNIVWRYTYCIGL